MKIVNQILLLLFLSIFFSAIGCGQAMEPLANPEVINESQGPVTPAITHLPLRILLADFQDSPSFNSQIDKRSLDRLITDVNIIYEKVGIQWDLEVIQRFIIYSSDIPDVSAIDDDKEFYSAFYRASPPAIEHTWTAVFMKTFPVQHGGLYIAQAQTLIFSEQIGKSKLLSAHVLAHELGHSLGLGHSEEENNLMAPGPTDIHDINFNPQQIEVIEIQAQLGPLYVENKKAN